MNIETANNNTTIITLYSLLGITNNATTEEIKKAYKKIALLVHPDKNQKDPNAAEKFRHLNQAYRILSDEEKRKVYDETGEYEENEIGNINDTYEFFRNIYPRIKIEDIDSFAKNYKGSLMEREDLIQFYEEKEGDLTQLLSYIPLSETGDIKRFQSIYKQLIKEGAIEKYANYNKTKNHIKSQEDFASGDEEEVEAKEKLNDLKQQIINNAKNRNSNDYFDQLAKQFGNSNGLKNEPQIDDAEFERIQQGIKKKNKKK